MAQYQKPVLVSVELIVQGYTTMRWMFEPTDPWGVSNARKLFEALSESPKTLPWGNDEIDSASIVGVNLIYWSTHPSRSEATGMIIDQRSFEE
jgi:hypothetical protein